MLDRTSISSPRLGLLLGLGTLYVVVCLGAFYLAPAWLPDSEIYWTLGRSLAQEGAYTRTGLHGTPELLRTPGYPAVVALAWLISPAHPYAGLGLLQCVLFGAIAVMTAVIGRWVLEDERGAWAGAITLIYPPLVYYIPAVLMEITLTAAALVFLVAWLAYLRRPRARSAAVLGLAGAVFAMVRPSFALVPLLVIAERLYRIWRGNERPPLTFHQVATHLVLILAIHSAFLVPWMARNTLLSEGRLPNPLGVGSGIILLLRATAQFAPEGELAARSDPAFISANAAVPPIEAAEGDARCLARARELIRPQRTAYLRDCLYLAVYRLWSESHSGTLPDRVLVLIRWMGALLLLLSAAGIWLQRERRFLAPLLLLVVYTGLIHSVGPAVARYTIPCRPPLIVLATGCLLVLSRERTRTITQSSATEAAA